MLTFEELYTQYANDVYRFALWLSGDKMEAEDITAETFVKIWGRLGAIRMETLKGYLLKIARNTFLGRRRKMGRYAELLETHVDPTPGPERMTEARLSLDNVQAFIRRLPECDRTAFVLRVQHDLPYREIARILEVSEVKARVKVHRIRKQMLLQGLDGRNDEAPEVNTNELGEEAS
jgi:RNA polymerase sigma-70 factor (ECF subfamily)